MKESRWVTEKLSRRVWVTYYVHIPGKGRKKPVKFRGKKWSKAPEEKT